MNETSLGFVGCTFENGTCDWEDISVGQSQWVRRNATGNTGPSGDNTLGSQLGKATHRSLYLTFNYDETGYRQLYKAWNQIITKLDIFCAQYANMDSFHL